jgi:hypothetical protein
VSVEVAVAVHQRVHCSQLRSCLMVILSRIVGVQRATRHVVTAHARAMDQIDVASPQTYGNSAASEHRRRRMIERGGFDADTT